MHFEFHQIPTRQLSPFKLRNLGLAEKGVSSATARAISKVRAHTGGAGFRRIVTPAGIAEWHSPWEIPFPSLEAVGALTQVSH